MTDPAAHLEATEARQPDIQQHDVRCLSLQPVKGLQPIGGSNDLIPFAAQRIGHDVQQIDVVFSEIELPSPGGDWRTEMRRRADSARAALRRHPWAIQLLQSRTNPGPALILAI